MSQETDVIRMGQKRGLVLGGAAITAILSTAVYVHQSMMKSVEKIDTSMSRQMDGLKEELIKLRLVTAENARTAADLRQLILKVDADRQLLRALEIRINLLEATVKTKEASDQ